MKKKKVLFYYLSAFSQTGGIEKFNRCLIKALDELQAGHFETSVASVYDNQTDERYNQFVFFKGFSKSRGRSLFFVIKRALQSDILVLGHINLAIAGLIVKILKPRCRLVIVAHGIEAWKRVYFIKHWCLNTADLILSVSNYTKNQLVLRNKINPNKIKIFPNAIDPHFKIPQRSGKPGYLLTRYGLDEHTKVILTLSRLSSSEQEKGYDKVIAALKEILSQLPGAKYILAGRYDEKEKERIEYLVDMHGLKDSVILTGFVDDTEVPDHYRLADIFIMPSRKEGFGIVFLEALACGTAVIGGNQDGTVDALRNGAFGTLINPTNIDEISKAVIERLVEIKQLEPALQQQVSDEFAFSRYKERLLNHLQ
jgi:glycosyltransferase involved in cell wall biosynthesis